MTASSTKQETDWIFPGVLTVKRFNGIKQSFKGIVPHDFDFWYKYSKFGMHVLREISLRGKLLNNITKDNWDDVLPILEKHFVTYKEVAQITRNLYHMENNKQQKVKEDPMFMMLQIFDGLNGSITFTELLNMEYKTFFKLYLYRIGNNVLSKRELRNTGEYT